MGMHLLQKMGWRPGEGLGKEKNGSLQPLLLEVKLDKKGLLAVEEVNIFKISLAFIIFVVLCSESECAKTKAAYKHCSS